MAGLLLPVTPVCVESEAVSVALPAVLRVTLKLLLPLDNCAPAGKAALGSLEVRPTTSLVLTTFQLASTALTVTLKALPAVWAEGVPLLPVAGSAAAGVSAGAQM